MITIADARIGQRLEFLPLPPFATPEAVLADLLPILDPPSRIGVSEAARRHVRIEHQGAWTAYDPEVTPYLTEPADMTASRRFRAVAFVGPSQSGKTAMLQTACLHRVTCDPMPVLIVHMDRPSRDRWVENKLDPMIGMSPAIAERLGRSRDDSTFSRKRFRGMRIEIGYPTPQQLSGGTYGLVAMTDFDHHPVMMGPKDSPEGTPYRMARQRTKTYMSRGCVLVESTPAHPWADPTWTEDKARPHMLPPAIAGIVNIYNEGSRGRWYWQCPDCDGLFEPAFDKLTIDEALDPGEAGAAAAMVCDHCGTLIQHRHKVELNRRAMAGHGGWLHEGAALDDAGRRVLVRIGDSDLRGTDVASYCLDGAAATFASWSELVANWLGAKRKSDALGDESELSGVTYTEIGKPYRPKRMDRDDELGLQFLKDHQQPAQRGEAPPWARFLLVSVDVQANRFPVQVTAFGPAGMAQIVDRWDITQPPEAAPDVDADPERRRAIRPPRYAEDWAVLAPLGRRAWPVAGAGYALQPAALVVDFQGEAGTSDNAERFWRQRRRAQGEGAWFVSRGHGGFRQARRTWYETPEHGSKGRKARAIRILNMAVDRLKDTVATALAKARGDGDGALYVPDWLSDEHRGELIAEVRLEAGWDKRAPQARNETLDLTVQARALAEHLGLLTLAWDQPPTWAEGGPGNRYAVARPAAGQDAAAVPAARPAAAPAATTINWLTRR